MCPHTNHANTSTDGPTVEERKVSVYLDGDNVSAIERLHGELSRLVDLPRLVEGAEGGVDGGNAGRRGAEGGVHHDVLLQPDNNKHAA